MKLIDVLTENEEDKIRKIYKALQKGSVTMFNKIIIYELPPNFDRIYNTGKEHFVQVYRRDHGGTERPWNVPNIKLTLVSNNEEINIQVGKPDNNSLVNWAIELIQSRFNRFNVKIEI